MLMLLKILMPLSSPVDALSMYDTVSSTMMPMAIAVDSGSVLNTAVTPARSCRTPITSVPTIPNSTACTARTSAEISNGLGVLGMALRIGEEVKGRIPRRKVKYAITSAHIP